VQQATDFGDGGVRGTLSRRAAAGLRRQPRGDGDGRAVAYLQMLGTLVDFSTFSEEEAASR
jgi:cytochrome c oxidase cbb3-type subunit 2